MSVYLYLSMIPEALVASMLPPEEFGVYLATGTKKRPHGQAIFFDIKPGFRSDYFDLSNLEERCAPHPDGRPKHSLYLGIYRVLEHVPLEAIGDLWLVTAHGQVLRLSANSRSAPSSSGVYHLYQEICPVHPLIASSLDPERFCRFITDPTRPIHVPRICFVELSLAGLADDPVEGSAHGLPYDNIDHIRDCLVELTTSNKHTKTVDRIWRHSFLYRCVKNGFFVGDQERMLYYPYPTREEMETVHYRWWRCANDAELSGQLSER